MSEKDLVDKEAWDRQSCLFLALLKTKRYDQNILAAASAICEALTNAHEMLNYQFNRAEKYEKFLIEKTREAGVL